MTTPMNSTLTTSFTPGLEPPPGVEPDRNAPNHLRSCIIIVESICLGLTAIFLAIRSGVRVALMKRWNLEDWMAIFAWTTFIGYSGLLAHAVTSGAGAHQWNLSIEDVEYVMYLNNVEEIVYSVSILTIKMTLLYIYQRLFSFRKHSFRWWVIAVNMALNVFFYTGLTLAKLFYCTPRDAIWDAGVPGAYCGGSLMEILLASGTWNTLSDIAIFSMPMLFICKMPGFPREDRRGVIALFSLGCIAPVFSALGVAMRARYTPDPDQTYCQWRILFFAYAELTTGFLCICVPTLPRLLHRLKGRAGSTFHHPSMPTGGGRMWPGQRHFVGGGRFHRQWHPQPGAGGTGSRRYSRLIPLPLHGLEEYTVASLHESEERGDEAADKALTT